MYNVYFYVNKIQQDASLCRYLFTTKSHSTCFGYLSQPSSGEHKSVTAASGKVLCSPDDGSVGHPKRVESDFAVNKYLLTVASC